MFARLNTPQEALNYKLEATLKAEQKVLEILDDNIEHAQDEKVKQLRSSHREESEKHVGNVEEAFRLLDWEVDDSSCPAIPSSTRSSCRAMGRDDVARLLHQNFESEQGALEKVRALQAEVAAVTPKQPA